MSVWLDMYPKYTFDDVQNSIPPFNPPEELMTEANNTVDEYLKRYAYFVEYMDNLADIFAESEDFHQQNIVYDALLALMDKEVELKDPKNPCPFLLQPFTEMVNKFIVNGVPTYNEWEKHPKYELKDDGQVVPTFDPIHPPMEIVKRMTPFEWTYPYAGRTPSQFPYKIVYDENGKMKDMTCGVQCLAYDTDEKYLMAYAELISNRLHKMKTSKDEAIIEAIHEFLKEGYITLKQDNHVRFDVILTFIDYMRRIVNA